MAGLYVHIPFCKQACSYCDFYFTTSKDRMKTFLSGLLSEIDHKAEWRDIGRVNTIYFGGGTPTQYSPSDLQTIFSKMEQKFKIEPDAEITIEANPENLTGDYLISLRKRTLCNRLSIGIQSFHNNELKLMNRAHDFETAELCVKNARKEGFQNISIDLIYGVPGSTLSSWRQNLEKAMKLRPEHLSAYCLTVEEGTPLEYQIRKGRLKYPEESLILDQHQMLLEVIKKNGYERYEVSNFSLPGKESKHNTSYWFDQEYIGFGPSAHSFIDQKRFWNIRNTREYLQLVNQKHQYWEEEVLTQEDRFNELIMTRLRTKWGLNLDEVANLGNRFNEHLDIALQSISPHYFELTSQQLRLTDQGLLMADKLASDLFIV